MDISRDGITVDISRDGITVDISRDGITGYLKEWDNCGYLKCSCGTRDSLVIRSHGNPGHHYPQQKKWN